MRARNSELKFGWVAILLHWSVAVAIAGLFALGYWMVGLSYYDPWYRQGPDIHRSVGVILFIVMVARLAWRFVSPPPRPLANHQQWEIVLVHGAHGLLYLLIFVAMVSGYLISTADGSAIQVFGLFEVPSITGQLKGLEDTAGLVHYWVTWALVVLAAVHALGALKHHFIDHDTTLRRILGLS